MRRPPLASVVAFRSMACAIWGRARWTAGATLASSALMMVAICREDLRSRSAEAALDFSVLRWRSSGMSLCCRRFRLGTMLVRVLEKFLSPLRGLITFRVTHGLRRGLQSFAASRLNRGVREMLPQPLELPTSETFY